MSILDDNEKLKTLAMHDQLTGLPNRHYSLALLESRIKESKQFDIPFGIAILDIDHFKKVNDNYGHTIGDLVLQVFSKTCSGSIRKSDIIARYGGEEFLCIFTGVDSDSLKISLEQLRMLVSASTIRKDNLSVAITVSIGGTMVQEDDSIISIIERADRLMYQSKNNGRNQVTIG